MIAAPLFLALAPFGCQSEAEPPPPVVPQTTDTGPVDEVIAFPLPDDLESIPYDEVYIEALEMLTQITTQLAWQGHASTMASRDAQCPSLWTGEFDFAGTDGGDDDGLSWNDACSTDAGDAFDGWLTWDTNIQAEGDLADEAGLSVDASRSLEGNGVVIADGNIRYAFDGEASDSLSTVTTTSSQNAIYSSFMDASVEGLDALGALSETMPNGFRTDLFVNVVSGQAPYFEARGNLYLYEEILHDRFDSVAVDIAFPGPGRAGPEDCALEPLGWIGVRDSDAFWYDVVFLPRHQSDSLNADENDGIAALCDGCGQLFVHGLPMPGIEVCPDFSFLFDGSIETPVSSSYVLTFRD